MRNVNARIVNIREGAKVKTEPQAMLLEIIRQLIEIDPANVIDEIQFAVDYIPAPRSVFATGGYNKMTLTVHYVEGDNAKLMRLAALKREHDETERYLRELKALIKDNEEKLNAKDAGD